MPWQLISKQIQGLFKTNEGKNISLFCRGSVSGPDLLFYGNPGNPNPPDRPFCYNICPVYLYRRYIKKKTLSLAWTSLVLFGIGVLCLSFNSSIFLKLYPLAINILFLGTFSFSLFRPPTLIYRIAVIQDPSITNSPRETEISEYCRKVTYVWIVFFMVNGSMAAWSSFGSDVFWAVYNGGISYILMGMLFAGEYIVRKKAMRKNNA